MRDHRQPSGEPSPTSPPDGVPPAPPVATRIQSLPFGELTWENFERLCRRLVALDGDVEHCARYGRQGDAQAGIDIYARQTNGRYHCLQAKRHQSFGAAKIREAVSLFIGGNWASRTDRFTIAVQSSLRSTAMQEEIEQQAERLSKQGVVFVALDGEELSDQLRPYPSIVDDFFGRPWVQALLGDDVAAELKARLDGAAFAKARAQLTRVYETHFHFVDPGSFGSISDEEGRPALTLLERFQKPDIQVREAIDPLERLQGTPIDGADGEAGSPPSSTTSDRAASTTPSWVSRTRRLPLKEWMGEAQRLVVLGDAGSGKSTLLRVIALDLLHDQGQFPELAARWGRHLPVYIPFAKWSALAAREGGVVGVKEIVRRSLEQFLTAPLAALVDQAIDDGRMLLLVDGLDEWSNEQAARTTLSALVTTVEAHDIPVIVSSRPRGLERIGALPAAWRRGLVAPLSVAQQTGIASRWFSRFSSERTEASEVSNASLLTDRFMAELARDANLSTLASTPLLLIGLVTLALRGQILPRTRGDVYNQLVQILLEVHPSNRATAAGDTEPRFRHATDPEQRRAAVARLAFVIREQAGGGGLPLPVARDTLQEFLASPSTSALDEAAAARAAAEILSVNAETQGLIVEKGPGEVGFVHASFEEYLGAEHIGGWPFDDISTFVRARAGDARWRNVITNLLGYLQRRDEVDRLVAVIEDVRTDELSLLNRQTLLGDIGFAVSTRAPATARRLALATMQRVESEDWLPARREALTSVLKGLGDPTLKDAVEERLTRWLPARDSWRSLLIDALGSWQPTPELQDTLIRAMHDEAPYAQRAAAKAYAKAFSPSGPACQRLVDGLKRSRDLLASAAMLESLALGWFDVPTAAALFQSAWESHRGEVRLVGALGLATRGIRTLAMRDQAMSDQAFWSSLSHTHRSLASELLAIYWRNDPELIRSAIARVSRHAQSPWEYDAAGSYLLACDSRDPGVRNWILRELRDDHPFNFHSADERVWEHIGRSAVLDPEIRAAANQYWQRPERQILDMHKLASYVSHAADPEVAAALHKIQRDDKRTFNGMWVLKALLAGWGREHPDVRSTIRAVIESADEDLEELVSLLPAVYGDKSLARDRLLRMGRRPSVRRDLLTHGLAECGCDGSDEEAVQSILGQLKEIGSVCEFSRGLFLSFGTHPAVRKLAVESLCTQNTSLIAIAAGYPNDPEFARAILDIAVPLPIDLRSQVVDLAVEGAAGTALERVLSQGLLEADPELRARLVAAHHARLPAEARDAAKQELLKLAVAVGPEFDSVRATALAGLTAMGALDSLVDLQNRGEPLKLYTGRSLHPMPSLERQICERLIDFESAFGTTLPDKFDSWGRGKRIAEILSVAPGASPAARTAFLKFAEQGGLPATVEAARSLAAERPRSMLLLQHCWRVLEQKDWNNTTPSLNAEIAVLLRAHFPDVADVRTRLAARYKKSPVAETAIALAVYSPLSAELPTYTLKDLGAEFGDWTIALHIATRRADGPEFANLVEAMVTRDVRTPFDVQRVTNLAVQERLQRDPKLEHLLSARIRAEVDRSISGSYARYLSAAGKLDTSTRAKVTDLLGVLAIEQCLPLAGYDAVAHEWRSTRAVLLDALSTDLN
jgi:energy-coupling factor transporter ATP-binding protein EcfA2